MERLQGADFRDLFRGEAAFTFQTLQGAKPLHPKNKKLVGLAGQVGMQILRPTSCSVNVQLADDSKGVGKVPT
jgi:hypothetical protein